VRSAALQIGHEADAARLVLKRGIIESLRTESLSLRRPLSLWERVRVRGMCTQIAHDVLPAT
jgi:hypothetical protein